MLWILTDFWDDIVDASTTDNITPGLYIPMTLLSRGVSEQSVTAVLSGRSPRLPVNA